MPRRARRRAWRDRAVACARSVRACAPPGQRGARRVRPRAFAAAGRCRDALQPRRRAAGRQEAPGRAERLSPRAGAGAGPDGRRHTTRVSSCASWGAPTPPSPRSSASSHRTRRTSPRTTRCAKRCTKAGASTIGCARSGASRRTVRMRCRWRCRRSRLASIWPTSRRSTAISIACAAASSSHPATPSSSIASKRCCS